MTKFAELHDGRVLEFPDETPDSVIDDAVKKELVTKSQFGTSHPAAKFSEGVMLGFQNVGSGFRQLVDDLGALTGAEPMYPDEQAAIAERDERMQSLGLPGQAGGIVGETLPSMAVPGGPGGALAKRVAGGVATDVAASVADPVREGQTRADIMTLTGGVSAVMRGVTAPFSLAANKLANAKSGDMDRAAKDLIDAADANDIRIFFDDVTGAPLAQKMSGAAEFFGRLGTGRGRELQNEDAVNAASRWLSRFAGDGDDYAEVVQEGLKRKLRIFQKEASRKYARAYSKIPDDVVETPKFDAALQAGIDKELAKGSRANQDVISLLRQYQESPRKKFEEMIEFRSDFNKDKGNLYNGNSPPNKTAGDVLKDASKALTEDMGDVAKRYNAYGEWRAADDFYGKNVAEFKEGKLKALLNDKSAANFDQQAAWRYLTQQTANPKRAQRMWKALDAKGRAAVREGLLAEAVEAATREGKPFSPAMFAGYLEKRSDVWQQFFRGSSKQELDGLIKVMRHIERAGQYAEDPPTGQRLIPWLLGTGAYFSPEAVAAGTAAAVGVKGAFQTQTGRNFLLAASTASPGSQGMNNIIEQMNKFIARSSQPSDQNGENERSGT